MQQQSALIFLSNRVHPEDHRNTYIEERDQLLATYLKEKSSVSDEMTSFSDIMRANSIWEVTVNARTIILQPVFQEKFGAAIVYTRYLVSIYRAIKLVKIGQSVHIHMALVLF